MSASAQSFRRFSSRATTPQGTLLLACLTALVACSGCFLADDFYVVPDPPVQADPSDRTSEPATTQEDGPPSSESTAKEVPPAKPLPSASSTGPSAPPTAPSILPSASQTAPDEPMPPMTGDASVPIAMPDASAPVSDTDEATEVVVIEAAAPTTETADTTFDLDAGTLIEAGPEPQCPIGWSYDPGSAQCADDCDEEEERGPNGRCYWFSAQAMSFATARSTCTGRGTGWSLMAVRSEAEDEFLQTALAADTWIGATDAEMPNTWRWLDDGTVFWSGNETGSPRDDSYARWGTEEPSAANDEACARYHGSPGSWHWSDCACDEFFRAGCHGPAPVEPSVLNAEFSSFE